MTALQHSWPTDRSMVRLIRARARQLRLPAEDCEDATQDILVRLSTFRFDDGKANGATKTTVLVAVIDRCLRTWLRTRRRYRDRVVQIGAAFEDDRRASGLPHPCYEEPTAMLMDIRDVVARLEPDERWLCTALSEGHSIDAIAAELGCSWHTVKRRIDQLRERFSEMDLHAWLG